MYTVIDVITNLGKQCNLCCYTAVLSVFFLLLLSLLLYAYEGMKIKHKGYTKKKIK